MGVPSNTTETYSRVGITINSRRFSRCYLQGIDERIIFPRKPNTLKSEDIV
jgi:hypothetical protein